MKKVISILKKTLKVILWVIISFVILLIVIIMFIQIPVVQKQIINYATSYISSKTHTRVELKKIGISFPKSVVIEGLFLEDTKKDTMAYIGKLKVNIAFGDLFSNNIHIKSVALENVNANLSRTPLDSLFNFNFLITAFSDPTKPKIVEPKTKTKSKWTFTVDDVMMKNVKFRFKDDYGGIDVAVNVKDLKLKVEKIDIANLTFGVDDLLLKNSFGYVMIKQPGTETEKTQKSGIVLPIITANKIRIKNTNFIFGDSVHQMSLIANINEIQVKEVNVDLPKENITVAFLSLAKSNAEFNMNDKLLSDTNSVSGNLVTKNGDWKITGKSIHLDDNSLAFKITNKPKTINQFNVNNMDYEHVTLVASNLYYSSAKTTASVKKLEAIDQNSFSILNFETDFLMNEHSIIAQNLKARTANSFIDADLNMQFSSLRSLKDSLQFLIVNANLKNVRVKNSDILYFAPMLLKVPFFKNMENMTSVSGIITGPINDLIAKNLVIKTGSNTILETDCKIVGLPEFKTAYFDFPDLKVQSGKNDILAMAGNAIPKSIEIPENIGLNIIFKGQIKSFESTLSLISSYGSALIYAIIDKNENFRANVSINDFDLGRLLKNKDMFGPVSLTAEANGHGLNKKTIMAKIKAEASNIYLNKYNYQNLKVDGDIKGMAFEGKINLNDENAVFDFDGLVNINPKEEQYKFNLDLKGANLQKLNLTKDDLRIGLIAVSDLKGGSVNELNGNAGITKIIVAKDGKQYILDTFLLASINEPGKSELNVSSALIGIKYSGSLSPASLPKEITKFINKYFPISDSLPDKKKTELQNFNFSIQFHNHPILSGVLLPQLKEFEPGLILGSFNSEKSELKLNASMRKIVYGTTEISNLTIAVNSDNAALNYRVYCSNVSNSQIKLDSLLVDGKLAENIIFANISSTDDNQSKKLLISSQITKNEANYKVMLAPKDFFLMNKQWDIAADNYVEFGKEGYLIHHLFISNATSQINIASVNDKFNDDINVEVKNFDLEDISKIIEKDTSLVRGNLNGNVLLKRVDNTYGLIADAKISNLFFHNVAIGDLSVKAENPTAKKFNIDVNLSGNENDLTANGYYIPNGGDNSINIKAEIRSLSLKTVQAFSMGNIKDATGNVSGNFLIEGKTTAPEITGELLFSNAFITPAALNNRLELKHETVQLKKDGIYFNSFTIRDAFQHTAIISGSVKMQQFKNINFALHVDSKDFLLFNTTIKDNKVFFGRMVIDSKIDVSGPLSLPVVNANIKMKKGSNFTFVVPEKKANTDIGEDIVVFEDSVKLNSILIQDKKNDKQKSLLKGYDIAAVIEVDKEATLKLMLDPSSNDSLVVKGEAALNFAIDRSGKMSLTGTYNINEGNYLISLESVIKRKFVIDPGSTIIWNGDPLDAEITINAIYSVRASPIDLVADQMGGMIEADKNTYKQRYPFLVILKLRGQLLRPEISFEIQLLPEDKGILGGAVNAKLVMLNEDPSALNKQVFALLILGRFIQENPLQTETNATSSIVRTTVGKFLSEQLNQLSSKYISGVELNFDIQSYDDYETGQAQGRTQIDIGVKKQLFKERLSVQIGGSVDVEGTKAQQNSVSDITSDITVEYSITKDGRYRLKGFRHNQYEGAIEGQLVETGVGVVYVRDFYKWNEFFRKPKIMDDSVKTRKNEK